MESKKFLVVYAHPEAKSFCGGMKDTIVNTLKAKGYHVKESDLYKLKYDPVLDKPTFKELSNPDYFNAVMEFKNASAKRLLNDQVTAETEKVVWADYIILVFPFWWGSCPAMMKGWLEKTLICGVGWDFGKIFDKALLRGKKAWVVTSTSVAEKDYRPEGTAGMSVEDRLHHITWGTLKFCGLEVLPTFVAYSVVMSEEQYRKDILADLEKKVKEIEHTKPIYGF
mmetsp:Transcript_68710/g.80091  ORF Transcript_68710/g.80091 Transcript_68710/m.80091 type:complete len:225 (+) Transcript_68710:43-717(+)